MNQTFGTTYLVCLTFNPFAYPLHPTSQDKERYKTFIETLQYVLPCSVCRKILEET